MFTIWKILGYLWEGIAFFIGLNKDDKIKEGVENGILKVNQEANEKAEQTAAAIHNLSDGDIKSRFDKL